ncbi:TetR/AcrR family transcriptional regulator [Amycolatopsis sp. H20-H5]|uniref:TetR/AcrR family transcriptional regulator n=1 Tax=Amycolatopsis sp. H20-H5 TaxID=3046309 RepID=UPI002DBC93CF|nr:helix-turn-helix domain-containing protein [Amycolatopsis sp. H20-H5]MEC3980669.1 helix-turn-helix domain-containing protein [Amycolatopsis sp. H20-H5]
MSPENRRRSIIAAVLPLVIDHGTAVTTNQIARAAGIGEGTIFRAFKDKEELFDACVHEALKPDSALDAIAEIPIDQPLDARLNEAAEALGAHLERMGAVLGAMHAGGKPRHRDPEHRGKGLRGGRRESMTAMRGAITELFEPEKEHLRVPAEQLASLFLALLFTRTRFDPEDGGATTGQVVDIFLNGALEAK